MAVPTITGNQQERPQASSTYLLREPTLSFVTLVRGR